MFSPRSLDERFRVFQLASGQPLGPKETRYYSAIVLPYVRDTHERQDWLKFTRLFTYPNEHDLVIRALHEIDSSGVIRSFAQDARGSLDFGMYVAKNHGLVVEVQNDSPSMTIHPVLFLMGLRQDPPL
jgi:hypothetical protein